MKKANTCSQYIYLTSQKHFPAPPSQLSYMCICTPPHLITLVEQIYSQSLNTCGNFQHRLKLGIKEGCLLSPALFTLVYKAFHATISQEFNQWQGPGAIFNFPRSDLLWSPTSEDLAVFRPAWVGWKIAKSGRPPTTRETWGPLLGDHLVTRGVCITSCCTRQALLVVLIGPQNRCFGPVCTAIGGASSAFCM